MSGFNWLPHVHLFPFRLHWLAGLICVIVIGFSMARIIMVGLIQIFSINVNNFVPL